MHRKNPQRIEIGGYQGGGLTEIAAHKRSYAVRFFGQTKKAGASAAFGGRLRLVRTIDEDYGSRKEHHQPREKLLLNRPPKRGRSS